MFHVEQFIDIFLLKKVAAVKRLYNLTLIPSL
jgi:hypothetical protein